MSTPCFSQNGSRKSDRDYDAEIERLLDLPPANGGNGRRKTKASLKTRVARPESSTGVESVHDTGASPRPSRCSERATQPMPRNAGAFNDANGRNGAWTTFVVPWAPTRNGGNGEVAMVVTPGMEEGRVVYVGFGALERGEIEVIETNDHEEKAIGAPPLTSCAAPAEPLTACAAQQRDGKGRFVKGNNGGPGNPFNRRLAAMRKALCKAVTADDIRVLTATMLAKAREGDMAATKLLLLYAVGRPTEVVDPDRLDHEEWALFKESAVPDDYLEITRRLPPAHLCALFRAASPGLADGWTRMLADKLQQSRPQETAETACKAAKR